MQAEVNALLDVNRAPPSALRIFARRGDTQVLIVHGDDRPIDVRAGERLAWIDWYDCEHAAVRVSAQCSLYLQNSRFKSGSDGWHAYSVAHLKTLVRAAQNILNIKPVQAPDAALPEKQPWTKERDAQLCLDAGRGLTAKAIAQNPLVRSTEGAVFKRAQRLGISLSTITHGQIMIRRLPAGILAALDRGAEQAQLTREAYASRLLIAAVEDHRQLTAAT